MTYHQPRGDRAPHVRRWRRLATAATLGLGLLALAACGADPAARVNGEVITRAEHQRDTRAVQEYLATTQGIDWTGDPRAVAELGRLRDEVLQDMINVRLMRQQARQENIVVTDQEVEARVAEILQTAGREQVLGFMQARGLTALTFRQFMHDSLLQEKLMARHVPAPAATVEARQVRHVLAQTAEQAATARDRLAKGESWEKVAAEVSIDPGSKDRGGDLGFLTPGQTVPPFDQAAFSLPLNELSEVVQTQFGYHVLMATESRTQPASPQQVAAQRQQAFSQYLQSLRQAAAIETYQ